MKRIFFNVLILIAFTFISALQSAHSQTKRKNITYSYKEASLENLSRLYWALNRLEIENDTHIDNFLLINECDIYRDYVYNEFEWAKIRQFGREFIEENVQSFPLRFQFVQPLQLAEYNFEEEAFTLNENYKIDGIRRFEIFATDFSKKVCGFDAKKDLTGYPKAVFAELSRPIILEKLPMHPDIAQAYIAEKTKEFKKIPIGIRDRVNVYNFRDIYLVMKVKFFSSAGMHYSNRREPFAKLLGVLESIEVYDDANLKVLLYKEDFKRARNKKKRKPPRQEEVNEETNESGDEEEAVTP